MGVSFIMWVFVFSSFLRFWGCFVYVLRICVQFCVSPGDVS